MKIVSLLFLIGLVGLLPSCDTLNRVAETPVGALVIGEGGVVLVSEAVEAKPELAPVLLTLADRQDGLKVDPKDLSDERLVNLGVKLVGLLSATYNTQATAALISYALRVGVSEADIERTAEEVFTEVEIAGNGTK